MAPSELEPDYWDRFSGVARLIGAAGLGRLRQSRAAVVGIGGVGAWTAEALARSGVGGLDLIDLDEVCVTNVNRQIHALDGQIGRSKAEAMAERVRRISPACQVEAVTEFFTAASAERLLGRDHDVVIDAIDQVKHKALLAARCRERGIPLVVCGGGGGKQDPTAVRRADLAFATNDRLLKRLRKILRRDHGFPDEASKQPFGLPTVYSCQDAVYPWSDGSVCASPEPGSELRLDCESGFGTAAFVTGALGFAAAAEAVRLLIESRAAPS